MNRKISKPNIDHTMQTVHPNAAAIGVGATMHIAAVRADRTPEPERSFDTFTADLHRLVDWFTESPRMLSAECWGFPPCRCGEYRIFYGSGTN
jgi:hypothetical protein